MEQSSQLSDIIEAHRHCSRHREEICGREQCGCFYCLAIFKPEEIKDWVEEEPTAKGISSFGETALCPRCGIDSVIGSASGYPITKEFLARMKEHWFN